MLPLTPEQRAASWGNRSLQRLEGVGAFVRCLMPVSLSGGGSVTYSVWLRVDDDQLREANRVWTTDEYQDLILYGTVANTVKPWEGLLGESARTEVRDTETLPYLVAAEGSLLSRILSEPWDRDDVLSRIAHGLPVPVRQQITDIWSVERTAGLAPRVRDGVTRFIGPGRTVQIEAFDHPAGTTPAEAIARMTEGSPRQRSGELTEHDGNLTRHAFWLTVTANDRQQHELYGYAATANHIVCTTCVYDDPADLEWAQQVWRSARTTPTS